MENRITIIILAAGLGKRMKSDLAKVLHKLCHKPMIEYVLDTLSFFLSARIIIVVGHQKEKIAQLVKNKKVEIVVQEELLGTGHAVAQTEKILSDFEGNILVLCGDTPLLKSSTLERLIQTHQQSNATVTILTTTIDDPTGYGRIITDASGNVCEIIEEKDATEQEKAINLINTGTYCFKSKDLFSALKKITTDNKQGEYYLTDVVGILKKQGEKIITLQIPDPIEVIGINTQDDLKEAEKIVTAYVKGSQ
ncbi:MAG: sugar phosphate nucleotidyltransferase [bacterium]